MPHDTIHRHPPLPRCSGVLLHPTSLPGRWGCGDFGDEARDFIDWLARAGQTLWQILPLTPPGPGQSPYISISTHAGNPLLVSPARLADHGLLTPDELEEAARACAHLPAGQVNFEVVTPVRMRLLESAARRFAQHGSPRDRASFEGFCQSEAHWLDDYSLFMTLYERHEGRAWTDWPKREALRDPATLAALRAEQPARIAFWCFVQWAFDRQWQALRQQARQRGVRILGDIPIYCAHHSADVWACPSLFQLDGQGRPQTVAGVPPDYFSADGQKWGNPLYRWERHNQDGFAWWQARMTSTARHADLARIDHFRGFAEYWAVPADAPNAREGRWLPGPGEALFEALNAMPDALPIVAEDLGIITHDVTALRRAVGAPGMAVLQFAFGGDAQNPYLPHNLERDTVVYTGTHDNDTTRGWFEHAPERERTHVQHYLQVSGEQIHWDLIVTASASVAQVAVCQVQDVIGLGRAARMNTPGTGEGQWRWRLEPGQIQAWHTERLALLARTHGRLPDAGAMGSA